MSRTSGWSRAGSGVGEAGAVSPPGPGRGPGGCADLLVDVGGCVRRADGGLVYAGHRPGEDWVGHGYYARRDLVAVGPSGPVLVVLWVHRWRLRGARSTRSELPPGLVPRGRYTTLFVLLALWSWLATPGGLLHRRGHPAVGRRPADRTLQRWMARAKPHALRLQQAIRLVAIEKCEPRPAERLWEEIRGPPDGLVRRLFADPLGIETLWRTLAMLWPTADVLSLTIPCLLAEARGRWNAIEEIWPLR